MSWKSNRPASRLLASSRRATAGSRCATSRPSRCGASRSGCRSAPRSGLQRRASRGRRRSTAPASVKNSLSSASAAPRRRRRRSGRGAGHRRRQLGRQRLQPRAPPRWRWCRAPSRLQGRLHAARAAGDHRAPPPPARPARRGAGAAPAARSPVLPASLRWAFSTAFFTLPRSLPLPSQTCRTRRSRRALGQIPPQHLGEGRLEGLLLVHRLLVEQPPVAGRRARAAGAGRTRGWWRSPPGRRRTGRRAAAGGPGRRCASRPRRGRPAAFGVIAGQRRQLLQLAADAVDQLGGRLLGEGDHQDLLQRHLPGQQQIHHQVLEQVGLAGAGRGLDHRVARAQAQLPIGQRRRLAVAPARRRS